MTLAICTITDAREAIEACIRELLAHKPVDDTARAIAHLDFLWSTGEEGSLHSDMHDAVFAAATTAYLQQDLHTLDGVPRMLRGAAAVAMQHLHQQV